jgi:hypothetical protein
MPGKKSPGRLVAGDGKQAFSSSQSPSGGKRVPYVDSLASNAGGIRGSAPSGSRVPSWKK